MESNFEPTEFEDDYERQESAPIVALALLVAEWVKIHGVASLMQNRSIDGEDASTETHRVR